MSHEPDDDGNYLISSAAIKAFKSSISAVYDSTVHLYLYRFVN